MPHCCKVQTGLDDFITEKYADQIAAILAEWSASLLQSPRETQAIAKSSCSRFLGSIAPARLSPESCVPSPALRSASE